MTADANRDAEVVRWNATLASGDAERIEAERVRVLDAVHRRIMDDDPRAPLAGWRR